VLEQDEDQRLAVGSVSARRTENSRSQNRLRSLATSKLPDSTRNVSQSSNPTISAGNTARSSAAANRSSLKVCLKNVS
jgi:hypothetical protein